MAENGELKALWEEALAAYENESGRKLNNETVLKNLKTPEDLLHQIESEGKVFQDFRDKHKKLWSLLNTFVKPMTILSSIGTEAVKLTPWAPAAAVLGAVVYLVKSCEGVSNAYDWIEQIFAELKEFSDRLVLYAKITMDAALKKKIAAILAFILRIIGRSEYLVRNKRFKEYLRVTFLGKDEKTKNLLDNLNKCLREERSYVVALTYASTKEGLNVGIETGKDVKKIGQDIEYLTNAVKAIRSSQPEEDESLLSHTLSSTSAPDDVLESFHIFKKTLIEGTGAWLDKEKLFRRWMDQQAAILWLFGGPGAGKSYLSTWILMQLMDRYPQAPEQWNGVSIGYFYIKDNKEILRDANVILRTLVWQITAIDPMFKEHAMKMCKSRANTITADDIWSSFLFDYYRSEEAKQSYAILVLDGLDEASSRTRSTILGFARSLLFVAPGSSRPRIQFAIIGRATLKQDMAFTREEKHIEVSPIKNHDDIDRYIRKRLVEVEVLKEMRKLKPNGAKNANKTGIRIKKKVLEGAEGVFLWAKLLLDQIVKKELPLIEKILANPPHDLDEMIWSVFDRLAKDEDVDHQTLRKMLTWVAFARRPLLFGELDLVLSLPSRRLNLLLWKSMIGRFASVFYLRFPEGYDPDAETELFDVADDVDEVVDEEDAEEDDLPFDFTGDDDEDDESEPLQESSTASELFSERGDRGLAGLGSRSSTLDRGTHNFSNGQLRTLVTFSHSRIRDYLIREGSARTRRKPQLDINLDLQRVQIDMTLVCLEILRTGVALEQDTRYLADYPSRNLVWHLEGIERASITDQDRAKILESLHWLFNSNAGTKSLIKSTEEMYDDVEQYDEFWRTWLGTDQHVKAVQAWFGDAKRIAHLLEDEEALTWMEVAAYSTKEMLKPLMRAAANIWLTKTGYDSVGYLDKSEFLVWVLYGYLNLGDQGVMTDDLHDWAYYKARFWDIEPEKIQAIAEWAQLEKDTHWHTGLGWILMEGLYYEEAIINFEKALKQNSDAWVAMEGLARCWGEQGQYEKAIVSQEKAIKAIPDTMSNVAAYLFPRIAIWRQQLGDQQGAYDAAVSGYEADPTSIIAQWRFLTALHGRSTDILAQLRWLDKYPLVGKEYSHLVRYLNSGYDTFGTIGDACRTGGRPDFVLTALNKALALTDDSSNRDMQIWLRSKIAFFRYAYYDQVDEPIALWEQTLKLIASGSATIQKKYASRRRYCVEQLSQLYFDAAVAAHIVPEADSSKYADKLKGLSVVIETSTDSDDEGFDFYSSNYTSMLWGRWLKDYQGADAAVWRKCFKARLLEQMNMLDDNDPTNDQEGLRAVATSLFHAGDTDNAGAILAILFKRLEDVTKEENEGDEEKEEGWDDKNNEEDVEEDVEAAESASHGDANDGFEIISSSVVSESDISAILIQINAVEVSAILSPELVSEQTSGVTTPPLSLEHISTAALVELEEPPFPGSAITGGLEQEKLDEVAHKIPSTSLPLNLHTNSWAYTCDHCLKETRHVAAMYFCEVCLNKNWCSDCLPMVHNNSLPWRQCNPHHQQYCAWPIPEGARELAAEFFGGEVRLKREWLAKLRAEWMGTEV